MVLHLEANPSPAPWAGGCLDVQVWFLNMKKDLALSFLREPCFWSALNGNQGETLCLCGGGRESPKKDRPVRVCLNIGARPNVSMSVCVSGFPTTANPKREPGVSMTLRTRTYVFLRDQINPQTGMSRCPALPVTTIGCCRSPSKK